MRKPKKIDRFFSLFSSFVFCMLLASELWAGNNIHGKVPEKASLQDTIAVRGRVTDADDNTPLNGVSIENIRTHRGTATNASGAFSIAAQTADQIEFTFIG